MTQPPRPSRRVPAELLQKIKDAVNIVEVVGEHVVLRKSGANHSGLCPFHSERTPSFSVNEHKQVYHCYGCREGGDLLTFVQKIHGLDFQEAVEELAERARIQIPKEYLGGSTSDNPEAQARKDEARQKTEKAFKLNRFAAAYYHALLPKVSVADAYIRKRGLTDELIRNFYLGAALPGWEGLASHLEKAQAPLPLAVELGLIRPSTKTTGSSSGYFDLFRNRAIFPIVDLRGRVAGFGGRSLPGATGEAESPKYLNSSESFLFQKSKLAFGLFQAQKHIREKDEVILVEGYFDVLALHAAGFQNVVATCGTALTPEHLHLFRKFASRITVLFDSDRAGIAATERAMEIGLEHGLILNGAEMPPDLDPDEVLFDQDTGRPVEDGKARMQKILTEAGPLLDARIGEAVSDSAKSPEDRVQAIKRVGGWLAKFKDQVGREVRMQDAASRMGISRDLLLQAMGQTRPGSHAPQLGHPAQQTQSRPTHAGPVTRPAQVRQVQTRPTPGRAAPAQLSRVERTLLAGLARPGRHSEHWLGVSTRLPSGQAPADLFDYGPARDWVQNGCPAVTGGEELDPQLRAVLTEALVAETEIASEEFKGAIDKAVARSWARFSHRIKAALADAEAKKDAGLQSKLMKDYLDVQRKMKEFSSFHDED